MNTLLRGLKFFKKINNHPQASAHDYFLRKLSILLCVVMRIEGLKRSGYFQIQKAEEGLWPCPLFQPLLPNSCYNKLFSLGVLFCAQIARLANQYASCELSKWATIFARGLQMPPLCWHHITIRLALDQH